MMSFFKKKPHGKLLENAGVILQQAAKVWAYRCDLLSEEEIASFNKAREAVRRLAKEEEISSRHLDAAMERLHRIMCEIGGTIYPHKTVSEWVELIIVSAIIAGTIRSFFLQPFKIPTNSMYPTYHGMTAEVYPLNTTVGKGERIWKKITQWAQPIEVFAPVTGEVLVPLDSFDRPMHLPSGVDEGLFGTGILKSPTDTYALHVGSARVQISVPQEFVIVGVILKTYFPEVAALPLNENEAWAHVVRDARSRGAIEETQGRRYLRTGKIVNLGRHILNFSVLTGDMVFVDKLSYNFVKPRIGDPFIFSTKNIAGLNDSDGNPTELYYIKRLVGMPGDTLRVKQPVLFRNDSPISGKQVFSWNNAAETEKEYFGYLPTAYGPDRSVARPLTSDVTLPEHFYFAMGDNSANSYDSRGWGFVPEKEIIGRGLLILYPFTDRWGIAE